MTSPCQLSDKNQANLDRPPFWQMPDPLNFKISGQASSIPDDEQCFKLWDKYEMLENVREHSLMVAHIATVLAKKAFESGFIKNIQEVRASALLHDLAKTYCVRYGGSHALLGASWVLQETGNPGIAQGVILHVYWPWKLPEGKELCTLPFLVMYADKRVKHSECVTLKERFEDLVIRYGKTERARNGIINTWKLTQKMEQNLSVLLRINLDEYSFDCRGLVNRT